MNFNRNADFTYFYRDVNNKILFKVCRWDYLENGKKIKKILPFTSVQENNQIKFVCKWPDAPRILYNLPEIINNPDKIILVTEGEKAADAASILFPEFVTTCSSGGANGADKSDWSVLKGRIVYISPDLDDKGEEYFASVVKNAKQAGALKIFRLKTEMIARLKYKQTDIPKGYDLADVLSDNIQMPEDQLANFIEAIKSEFELMEDKIDATTDKHELQNIAMLVHDSNEMSEVAKHRCLKKIAKLTDATLALVKSDCNGISPKNQLSLARDVIKSFGEGNLLYTNTSFYRYDDKPYHWQITDDRKIKQAIQEIMNQDEISKQRIDSILYIIKSEIYKPNHQFDLDKDSITVKNGRLTIKDGYWELTPHDKFQYNLAYIPVEFNANATSPIFEQFLEDIFSPDSDKETKKILLIEAMGYSMLKTCNLERFFMLVGTGRNGKSVLLNTLKNLLGGDNVASVGLNQLGNKFQRAHLLGKNANLVTEIGSGEQLPDAEIKSLVSGERITVEQKFKSPFDFEPYATLWFATNHLPHSRDYSDALYRRAIIIPFNRQFSEQEIDVDLSKKLSDELPGILNLALMALEGLIQNSKFTMAESCIEANLQWRKQSDQIQQFIEDCCELGEYNSLSSEIYNQYKLWADENGVNSKHGQNGFSIRLKHFGVETFKGTAGIRKLKGIKLRELY